jgi:hypothetical protein
MRRCSRRSQSSRTSFKCRDSSTVALCNAASSPIRSLAAARIFTSRGTERPGRKVVISARKELLLLVWRMAGPGGCHSTVQLTRASGSAARCLIDLHIPYTLRIRDQHVISQCKARNNAIDYLSILRGYRLMRSSMSTDDAAARRSAVTRYHIAIGDASLSNRAGTHVSYCCLLLVAPDVPCSVLVAPARQFRFESLRERRGLVAAPVAEGRGINRIINMYSRTGDLASIASSERRISELGPGDVGTVSPSVLISSAA